MGKSPMRENHIIVKKLTVAGQDVTGGIVLSSGQTVDINGIADGLVLDADADTSISSPTDDQIDIEVSGADDFRITANTLTALSGSTIATDTLAETTAGSGITADSVLLKDGTVTARNPTVEVTADGAITVPNGNTTYFITKAGVAAMTLVDPTTVTHDGLRLTFISTTAQAHTLDLVTGINGGAADVGTWGGAAGDMVQIEAWDGVWWLVSATNVTFA